MRRKIRSDSEDLRRGGFAAPSILKERGPRTMRSIGWGVPNHWAACHLLEDSHKEALQKDESAKAVAKEKTED